jgi:hypothetical protein
MTPCGLRPFEPQCLWYNRLPCVLCVTGMPNGRQATIACVTARPILYPEPANDSIDNKASIKDGLRQMQALSRPQPLPLQRQPIVSGMASVILTRSPAPTCPHRPCPASLLLAPSQASQPQHQSNLQGCVPRQCGFFSPSDRKTRMMHACMRRARGRPQA